MLKSYTGANQAPPGNDATDPAGFIARLPWLTMTVASGDPISSSNRRLIIVCGMSGSGKTTLTNAILEKPPAVRMSADDWTIALGIDLWDSEMRAKIEDLQWAKTKELLAIGNTVVIEWGTWARFERDKLRDGARELGASVELRFLDVDAETIWQRIHERKLEQRYGSRAATPTDVDEWFSHLESPTPDEMALYDPPLRLGLAGESAPFVVERLGTDDAERYKALRLAALADAPDAFGSTLKEEEDLTDERWQQRLANPSAVTFVAVAAGRDVGLVTGIPHWDYPNDAALVSMWVAPKYRRARVGIGLIEELMAWAKSRGYAAVRLEVADENLPAIRLYEGVGFVPTGNASTLPSPRQHIKEHELIHGLE